MKSSMPSWILIGAIDAALRLASPPTDQPPADPDRQSIIVEGAREEDREEQIDEFVRALTDVPGTGQISRFERAVCPAVVGLAPAQDQAVVSRMRAVAQAGGVPLAAADCRPNVYVIVWQDKRGLIEYLRKEEPSIFEGLTQGEVRRLARLEGPVAAWHVEGLLDASGREVPRDPFTDVYQVTTTNVPSRIAPLSRPHFVGAVVAVEADSLSGVTSTQLADYAALRAFARTSASAAEDLPVPTILKLFQQPMDRPVPVTLTHWDLGFLRALYAAPTNRLAHVQRDSMRDDLERELEPVSPPEE